MTPSKQAREDAKSGQNKNPYPGQTAKYYEYNRSFNKAFSEKVATMTNDEYMEFLFGEKEQLTFNFKEAE